MTNAREAIHLRRILFDRLPPEAFDRVNMTALTRATARLSDQGWEAPDIASQILGDYGDGDPAALIVARLNRLDGPPPRPLTPTPPDIEAMRQERAQAIAAAQHVDHTGHAQAIRTALRGTR